VIGRGVNTGRRSKKPFIYLQINRNVRTGGRGRHARVTGRSIHLPYRTCTNRIFSRQSVDRRLRLEKQGAKRQEERGCHVVWQVKVPQFGCCWTIYLLKMAYHRRERSRSRERDGHYGGMRAPAISSLPTFTPSFTGGGVSTVL
jgi:hypothetical protein